MRDYVRRQQELREHGDFLHRKVEVARASVADGRGDANEAVEADFAVRRSRITSRV